MKNLNHRALEYHSAPRAGKIEVVPTKPYATNEDLALAYSPGVAEPCRAIHADREAVYRYTDKGNLVAVVSNGTAVLGLGNIGAEASKPVMEGKAMLFKIFADVDVFDIETACADTETFVRTVACIAPTFGGINLEDIKAPECFEIEQRLQQMLDIPVMHDDQHGTAIVSAAALLNALEIAGKHLAEVRIVVNGAGAAAIAGARLYVELGVRRQNIVMFDRSGAITDDRTDLNAWKREFATANRYPSLADALLDADVFLGLSVAGVLNSNMVRTMHRSPIIFALANPDPEITYEEAIHSRDDVIFATGRSDYPNQVNNVLGFPYIFRGALDVRASEINTEMKIAAVRTIAALAHEPVPHSVMTAYGARNMAFGRNYILPKPLDNRLMVRVSSAVARAAVATGVARRNIEDWNAYEADLQKRLQKKRCVANNSYI